MDDLGGNRAQDSSFEQARHLVEALARGTPHAGTIVRNIAPEKIRELV
jgi:uncharacterized protein YbjT (DUF2867 family)